MFRDFPEVLKLMCGHHRSVPFTLTPLANVFQLGELQRGLLHSPVSYEIGEQCAQEHSEAML